MDWEHVIMTSTTSLHLCGLFTATQGALVVKIEGEPEEHVNVRYWDVCSFHVSQCLFGPTLFLLLFTVLFISTCIKHIFILGDQMSTGSRSYRDSMTTIASWINHASIYGVKLISTQFTLNKKWSTSLLAHFVNLASVV